MATKNGLDSDGNVVPEADNNIKFTVSGPGEIVATDNGNAADLTSFSSKERKAFNGLVLVVIRSNTNKDGTIKVTAKTDGIELASLIIKSK